MPPNLPVSPTEQEASSSPQELAKKHKVSVKTIRRLFEGEVGVIMLRPRGDEQRRPRYMLRIPHSVERRVMQRLSLKRPGSNKAA